MSDSNDAPTTQRRPPERGWELGAGGLTKVAWGVLALLLLILAALLFATGYIGYGGMILILALAAAVNLT